MKRWRFLGRAAALFAAVTMLLAGCSDRPSPIKPAAPVAEQQFNLIVLSLGIMLVVCAVVFIIFFIVLIRFREKPGEVKIPKQVEGNHKLEITWTVIPILLLIVLAIPTVALTFSLDEDHSETEGTLNVSVVAHQFWWEFNYPDLGVYTSQELIVPENTRVQFTLDSVDVIHSFWIPAIGGKMDTNVGVTNRMYLDMPAVQPDPERNIYVGKCAEYCGEGHALMDFKVKVLTEEDFNAWVEGMRQPTQVTENVQRGEELFAANCISCHAINGEQPSPSGPNLKGYANRDLVAGFRPNNEQWLKDWIRKPTEVKPGATMPALGLSEDEIDALVQYLFELK